RYTSIAFIPTGSTFLRAWADFQKLRDNLLDAMAARQACEGIVEISFAPVRCTVGFPRRTIQGDLVGWPRMITGNTRGGWYSLHRLRCGNQTHFIELRRGHHASGNTFNDGHYRRLG